jgi:hypothetical protein
MCNNSVVLAMEWTCQRETDFGVAILLFAGNRVTYLRSLSFEQCECIVLMFPFGGAQVCDGAR